LNLDYWCWSDRRRMWPGVQPGCKDQKSNTKIFLGLAQSATACSKIRWDFRAIGRVMRWVFCLYDPSCELETTELGTSSCFPRSSSQNSSRSKLKRVRLSRLAYLVDRLGPDLRACVISTKTLMESVDPPPSPQPTDANVEIQNSNTNARTDATPTLVTVEANSALKSPVYLFHRLNLFFIHAHL